MNDILPYIAELLSAVGQVELSYSDVISRSFPLIVLTEISNTAAAVGDGEELFSNVTVQIDVYESTDKKVRDAAREISSILTSRNFRRKNGFSIKEDGMKRYMLEFSCGIDKDKRIYQGANYF